MKKEYQVRICLLKEGEKPQDETKVYEIDGKKYELIFPNMIVNPDKQKMIAIAREMMGNDRIKEELVEIEGSLEIIIKQ